MIQLKHRPETLNQPNDLVKEYVEALNKGDVFYDLGACVGTYGILAYSLGCEVVAFEVDEVNYDALKENFFLLFGYEQGYKALNIGIADKEGAIQLYVGQSEIGGHHKTLDLENFCGHPASRSEIENTITVPVDGLDNLIMKHNLPKPQHIKIDIDGSEYAFLAGAKQALTDAESIIIELYEDNDFFQKIVDVLEKEHKFTLFQKGIELESGLRDYWFKK